MNDPRVYKPNLRVWERNPLYLYVLVSTILGALATFGFQLNGEQIFSIMAITNVLLTLIYNVAVVPLPQAENAVNTALYTPVPSNPEEAAKVKPHLK